MFMYIVCKHPSNSYRIVRTHYVTVWLAITPWVHTTKCCNNMYTDIKRITRWDDRHSLHEYRTTDALTTAAVYNITTDLCSTDITCVCCYCAMLGSTSVLYDFKKNLDLKLKANNAIVLLPYIESWRWVIYRRDGGVYASGRARMRRLGLAAHSF